MCALPVVMPAGVGAVMTEASGELDVVRPMVLGNRRHVSAGQQPRRGRTTVKFSDVEWATIVTAAAAEGLRPGAWLAQVGFEEASRRLRGEVLDRALIAGLVSEVSALRRQLAQTGGRVREDSAGAGLLGSSAGVDAVLIAVQRAVRRADEVVVRVRRALLS